MGRTYEALSHGRTVRVADEDEVVPPTAVIPIFQAQTSSVSSPEAEVVEDDQASADTALLDDLSHDNDDVPFIEVGGPKGTKPLYGPNVDPTPVPDPSRPLRIGAAPAEPPKPDQPNFWSVTFLPLPATQASNGRIGSELVAYHSPDHPVSAQYRGLLAGLEAQRTGAGKPLMIFVTVGPEMEASSVVLNLAVTCAREGRRRVLAIEANHERPLLAERLGIASRPGLRELLNRSIPTGVALHPTAQKSLFVLPPGNPDVPVSSEAEARLPAVVEQVCQRFDWVLVNGPEWGSGGAAEWTGLAESVYLVVRAEQWDSPEVETAHEAIVNSGGKLRGYVALRQPDGSPLAGGR